MQAAVDAQQQWLTTLRAVLPPELQEHVVGAVPRRGTLIVYAASAAWCGRLRYALADGLAACQAHDPAIRSLAVRVLPPGRAATPRR